MNSLSKNSHNATTPSSINIYVQSGINSLSKCKKSPQVSEISTQGISTNNWPSNFEDQRIVDQSTQIQFKHRQSFLCKQYNAKLIKIIEKQNLKIHQKILTNKFLENEIKNQRSLVCHQYNIELAERIAKQKLTNDLIFQQSILKSTICTTNSHNDLTHHMQNKSNILTTNCSLLDPNYAHFKPITGITDKELMGIYNQHNLYNQNYTIKNRNQGIAVLDPNHNSIQLSGLNKNYRGINILVPSKATTNSSQINDKNAADPSLKCSLKSRTGQYYQYKKGCQKLTKRNTNFCIAHGGGKRYQTTKCKKGVVVGTKYCVRHDKEREL